jgi:hypothetical protein
MDQKGILKYEQKALTRELLARQFQTVRTLATLSRPKKPTMKPQVALHAMILAGLNNHREATD